MTKVLQQASDLRPSADSLKNKKPRSMASDPRRADPSPRDIIATARANPAPVRGTYILGGLSAALLWGAFTPLNFSPLAWIALVPMLTLVRLDRPTNRMYRALYACGAMFWLPTLQWMRLGDPTMYIAWVALSLYLAVTFPLFVGVTRVAVRRLRLPLVLGAPAVWVGLEYARAYLLTGFSWYYLGHSQYRWLDLIQISDLLGGYGVSFLIAANGAAISLLIPQEWMQRLAMFPPSDQTGNRSPQAPIKTQWLQIGTAVVLLAGTLGYGAWRRSGAEFPAGPRVAAIQGNFPTSVKDDHDPNLIFHQHMELSGEATKKQPDLIVWPEGMFPWAYFATPGDLSKEELREKYPQFAGRFEDRQVQMAFEGIAQKSGAAVVIGCQTVTADKQGVQFFNSATFVTPEQGIVNRYDKLHRVPFGEYIPLKDLVSGLQYFTPYRGEFGINAGKAPVFMTHKGVRYAPVICFEDTVPQLVRGIVHDSTKEHPQQKEVDVLLNLTNDGWFHGSSELDQHLITAAFRCVECRVPMVRAVNTGISAVIDGDGAIRARAVNEKTGKSKLTEAYLVESVPLDPRQSAYVRYGDWFAAGCLGLTILAAAWGLFLRNGGTPKGETGPILTSKPAEQLA